ncbi:unnamed protein product [Heterotrigona itama]|uniref:G domain-containing protein n=1 Tax=Heterotrigona itama TaxID=395501 RepID=A0A6V7HIK6_9HYME|nr:unnamed protein product [Heterotrigona itama]
MRFLLFGLSRYGVRRNSGLREFRRWHAISYKNVEPTSRRKLDANVLSVRDKLLYCDYLDLENVQTGFKKRKTLEKLQRAEEERERYEEIAHKPVFSVLLNNRTTSKEKVDSQSEENDKWGTAVKEKPVHMPYAMVDSYEMINSSGACNDAEVSSEEYESLHDSYLKVKTSGLTQLNFEDFVKTMEKSVDRGWSMPQGELWKIPDNWMTDYEQFDDSLMNWYARYGTPDPDSKVSSVPCGGCGALLHCRDPAIPGYLPSELFPFKNTDELKSTICQRCHFLKFYNAALEVKVSIEDYPRLLKVIKSRKCAIVLIIDVTDFPCCIWPDLKTILHPFTPIFLVGNKVDLLPKDCPSFLENVKRRLIDAVIDITGVKRENITHVQLTSAKTGYGIEQLINNLQNKWQYKGDVYLVGCTNVGKSSLFNTLINSDYCKVQAIDLVQRATVSAWPGTTLNLLKFPILNPTGKKRWLRTMRLVEETSYKMSELEYNNLKFKETRNIKYATLKDHVGKTFITRSSSNPMANPFSETSHRSMCGNSVLDESRPEYKQTRWCYDTPGTIQIDQILNLLTTDELLLTLPQEIISPRTFMFKPEQTVFVAGMGRLDYLEGEHFIRCTLFASKHLPITMCRTTDADEVYDRLLTTKAFVVPVNDPERLKSWPKLLKSKEMNVVGVDREESVADVVLSSIGWIAITPFENESALLRAWTPQGRGIYLRSPPLLSKSVSLRGRKVQGTPMYLLGRQVNGRDELCVLLATLSGTGTDDRSPLQKQQQGQEENVRRKTKWIARSA